MEKQQTDNMPPEAIKAGGEVSEEVLLDLCNQRWSEEKVPDEWKKGLIIKLPKKRQSEPLAWNYAVEHGK